MHFLATAWFVCGKIRSNSGCCALYVVVLPGVIYTLRGGCRWSHSSYLFDLRVYNLSCYVLLCSTKGIYACGDMGREKPPVVVDLEHPEPRQGTHPKERPEPTSNRRTRKTSTGATPSRPKTRKQRLPKTESGEPTQTQLSSRNIYTKHLGRTVGREERRYPVSNRKCAWVEFKVAPIGPAVYPRGFIWPRMKTPPTLEFACGGQESSHPMPPVRQEKSLPL